MKVQNTDQEKHSLMRWAAVIIFVAVAYVLSQAPVTRIRYGMLFSRETAVSILGDSPVYYPVDWLVIHTPVRGPLQRWADLWGVQYGEVIAFGTSSGADVPSRTIRHLAPP